MSTTTPSQARVRLRTLADIRRAATEGACLEPTFHRLADRPWAGGKTCPIGIPRRILIQQTYAVALELNPGSGDGKTSWLRWPKAAEVPDHRPRQLHHPRRR